MGTQSPVVWAGIIALAASACSRDHTMVGKSPPQPTSERKDTAQVRRATPAKAAAGATLRAPTKLARSPFPGTRESQSAPTAVQTSPTRHLKGTKHAPTPPLRSSLERQNALGKQRLDRPRAALTQPASTRSPGAPKAVPARPAVEAVVYDVSSGIKTLFLTNGDVKEEPFDPGELAAIKVSKPRSKPRVSIVNEDALETGSATDLRPRAPPSDKPTEQAPSSASP
jgi:hypothetical protein